MINRPLIGITTSAGTPERLIAQIEADLQYDETGKSYLKREVVLNLVFRVTDFMRQLSKRI